MTSEPGNERPSRTFVVDRREGRMLVLVGDDATAVDVPASRVPKSCRGEGSVLRVPLDDDGVPLWSESVRDHPEEKRRRADLANREKRLRSSDPGGDIVL
jgi:hypothetical protein